MKRFAYWIAVAVIVLPTLGYSVNLWVYDHWGFAALYRGAIGFTHWQGGPSGPRDNGQVQPHAGFSYPVGGPTLVFSGNPAWMDWNQRNQSAGEGIWLLGYKEGDLKGAFAGPNHEHPDVVGLTMEPQRYPEAYVGPAHHQEWALSTKWTRADPTYWWAGPAEWTHGPVVWGWIATYAPPRGDLAQMYMPLITQIWNYRYNDYKDPRPFRDRIASGEFPQLDAPAWAEDLSEDDFPDNIAISRSTSTDMGLEWSRRWLQWGHADYDDFLINETVVENVGNTAVEGLYIILANRFFSSADYSWFEGAVDGGSLSGLRLEADDYVRSTLAPNYLDGGPSLGREKPGGSLTGASLAGDGHAMVYLHDGDQLQSGRGYNDWGGPFLKRLGRRRLVREQKWIAEGFLNHPTYWGLGVIDALPPFNTYGGLDTDTYVSPHDRPETSTIDESVQQPASITMWRFGNHQDFDHPDPTNSNVSGIYAQLTREWPTQNGYMHEPAVNDAYTEFVSFGPYDLEPGDKAKVVVAYVGGMASQAARYDDYRRYGRPFEFAWMNMYNGVGQPPARWEERQAEVPLGEEMMFKNFRSAIDAYTWGYDIPNQPPNIRLSFRDDEQGRTVLDWSGYGRGALDPDYGGEEARDILGYRLYRSTTLNTGPFELVWEYSLEQADGGALPRGVEFDPSGVFHTPERIPGLGISFERDIPLREDDLKSGLDEVNNPTIPGLFSWTDPDSRPGFHTWYALRTYDTGHSDWKGKGAVPSYESAPGPLGVGITGTGGTGSESAMTTEGVVPRIPRTATRDRFEDQVHVIPNPFSLGDQAHNYAGKQDIRFVNLPARCRIEIHNIAGDRLWEQYHNSTAVAEAIWQQTVPARPGSTGEAIAPGIYFWKVTSLVPESTGKVQTGTLLIIK